MNENDDKKWTASERFEAYYQQNILREGAAELLDWLKTTDFFTAPASTRYHGAYENGLCEHSVAVLEQLKRLWAAYPEAMGEYTRESIVIVALLHDVCKVGCYKTEMRNTKDENGYWIKVPYYTFEEDFAYGGHGAKSVFLIGKYMTLTDDEAVAINCHMGAYDRAPGDYSLGAAFTQHPLALMLSCADQAATFIDGR